MLPAALALILVVIGLFVVFPARVRHRHVVHEREQTTAEDSTARVLDRTARDMKNSKRNKTAVPLLARGQTQSLRLEPGAVKELTASSDAVDGDNGASEDCSRDLARELAGHRRRSVDQSHDNELQGGFRLRPGALWPLVFLLVGFAAPVVSLVLAVFSVVQWWVFGVSTFILPLVAFVLRRNAVRRLNQQRLQRAERRRIERQAQQNVQRAADAGLSEADTAGGELSSSEQETRIIDLRADHVNESAVASEDVLPVEGEPFTDAVDAGADPQPGVRLGADVVDTPVAEPDCVDSASSDQTTSAVVGEGTHNAAQEHPSTGSQWSPRPVPKPSYQMKQKAEHPLAVPEVQVPKKRHVEKADAASEPKTPEKADAGEVASPAALSLAEQPVKYRRAIKDLSAVMDERRRAV